MRGFPCNLDERLRWKPEPKRYRKMANEVFAHAKIVQFLKCADRVLADGRSVGFRHPLDNGGDADCAPYGCQGGPLETKRTGVNSGADETQKARYVNA